MVKLYCKKCNFRGEKDHIPEKCPYCHRIGTLEELRTAQDLIDEVL